MILAIDSSTAIAGVALYDGSVSAEMTWRSGRNHSMELMGQVAQMLKLRRVEMDQLTAIAVATGPGSYTGLRVGISAGKGLCLALKIPMIGVCSLDILAEAHLASCVAVRPLLDAGRHRYATALYRRTDGAMSRVSPIEGVVLPMLHKLIQEKTLLCGDLDPRALEDYPELRGLVEVASPAASLRRAGYLAEIAWRRYHTGEVEDAAKVEAYYLGQEGG